jgi:hypothetical protein
MLFSGINDEKLNDIYKFADLNVTEDEFKKLYEHATSQKYCFLWVNTSNSTFRKCFNMELKI